MSLKSYPQPHPKFIQIHELRASWRFDWRFHNYCTIQRLFRGCSWLRLGITLFLLCTISVLYEVPGQ